MLAKFEQGEQLDWRRRPDQNGREITHFESCQWFHVMCLQWIGLIVHHMISATY